MDSVTEPTRANRASRAMAAAVFEPGAGALIRTEGAAGTLSIARHTGAFPDSEQGMRTSGGHAHKRLRRISATRSLPKPSISACGYSSTAAPVGQPSSSNWVSVHLSHRGSAGSQASWGTMRLHAWASWVHELQHPTEQTPQPLSPGTSLSKACTSSPAASTASTRQRTVQPCSQAESPSP